MFGHCKSPVWRNDDFTQCFQIDFLQILLPTIACGLSAAILFYQAFPAKSFPNLTFQPPDTATDEAEDDEDDSVAELTLQRTTSLTDVSIREVDKPKGEILLVAIEFTALLGQLAVALVACLNTPNRQRRGALAQLCCWGYVTILTGRGLCTSFFRRNRSALKLWNQTAFLYGSLWLCETLTFRSIIIHPRNDLSGSLAIVQFTLSSLLFLISLTSRRGNRAVSREYENDLEPSREPLASVFSIASFAWVDGIVWRGYQKTLEIKDVWNIHFTDKAAPVLSQFRQIKTTHSLVVRLLLFFKTILLIQGAWAMLGSFCLFIPTLLLKAILEYLEDPRSTPANAAWFYVILLFVVGIVQAVANGQGLWIGRKVSMRLRAIIVGEIYSKALRRKVAASVENEEKKDDGDKPATFAQRLFGRKKTVKAVTTSEPANPTDTQANNGKIINLMSVDSFKVAEVCAYLHFLWAAVPVQIGMAITLLYNILGASSFVGIVMMVLLLPLNFYIATAFSRAQKKIMAAMDTRIQSTNEVLQNIRIIKYFAWEQRFAETVNDKRRTELSALRSRYILWALASTIWSAAPILITFISFLIYTVAQRKPLLPSIAFPALSTFALLRIPLDQLADMVAHVQDSKVSVDRVEEFLNEEETEKYLQLRESRKREHGEVEIALDDATLTWGSKKGSSDVETLDAFRLINMNVNFKTGVLNVIAGPTGSGKTSLLMALLGEMKLLKGNVRIPGGAVRQELRPDPHTCLTESVAYCAQQAWLVNDTIKENILFASPFDQTRYDSVIAACALKRDLEILDAGDQTLVGEKGIALSGGQKQRISLARAMYCNSKHLLLDDCLSAVDSHTAKHIFEDAIMGEMMRNRTCILVTHNLLLTIPRAQYVVVLQDGKVAAQGSPDEVMESGRLGEDLLKSRPDSHGASATPSRVVSNLEELGLRSEKAHANGHANGSVKDSDRQDKKVVDTRIEAKAEGAVKMTTIKMYLTAMGPWYFWPFAGFAFIATQLGSVATNVWIRQWANSYQSSRIDTTHAMINAFQRPGTNTDTQMPQHPRHAYKITTVWSDVNVTYYLGIYALIGLAYVLICLSREMILFWGSLHASWSIHERLLRAILRAKFKFFDSTPLGQLMNRFSKDVQSVDQDVAPVAIGMIHSLASVITIVILISIITPQFLIAGIFIGAIYFATAFFYIHSSRDLKRIEAVQRTPLFQAFGETLTGVVTIRAYGDEARFLRDNHHRVDTHNRPFIYLWATNRWLAFRVDVAGALVAFSTGVFAILNVGHIDAGAAGLSLSYAITFTENVLWLVRLYAANEQNMNAVERVKEYIEVEQEAPAEVLETKPAANWPSCGGVQFSGYSTKYRKDLEFVLKNVSFSILPGEKVGIVGRTGAGKSSLALALFRGLEAEEGKILIDNVDIGLIGLQDLREAITIVPQDPTLFTGTLRSNLDPFGLFTDEEIYAALRRVQLISSTKPPQSGASTPTTPTASPPHEASEASMTPSSEATLVRFASNTKENKNIFYNLSSPIAESGSNLSQGQRQLLCLARALLKSPRVLVMDEATASIDYATDSKIQETLRELKDNTIITIAHRLHTIVDYDKVLVLDKGEVVEFADPWELIQKEGGWFRSMCEMSGDMESLRGLAKKAWQEKRLIDDS